MFEIVILHFRKIGKVKEIFCPFVIPQAFKINKIERIKSINKKIQRVNNLH